MTTDLFGDPVPPATDLEIVRRFVADVKPSALGTASAACRVISALWCALRVSVLNLYRPAPAMRRCPPVTADSAAYGAPANEQPYFYEAVHGQASGRTATRPARASWRLCLLWFKRCAEHVAR